MDVSLTYANQLKGLLAKADGKDKFIALLQYAAMFASAGEPGAFLAAQKSLSAARKPFRVFKPVEFLMPLVERPPKGKGLGACLAYVKAVGMALYVGADHVVWAASAGIFADENAKARGDFFQKLSLWSWFAASVASVLTQTSDLTKALDEMSALKEDVVEDDDDKKSKNDDSKKAAKKDRLEKQRAAAAHARAHMRAVVTSGAQALLALALLDKTPLSKRHVGALGVAVSLANCAALAPARKSKTE